jgi:PLD-like domain
METVHAETLRSHKRQKKLRTRVEFYLRSVSRRWKSGVLGADRVQTLIGLQEHGCTLYDLPNLHAKIVLVPGSFASIGSQNVTKRGTLNREATSVFTRTEAVAAIEEAIRPWLDERQPITREMIDEMNAALPPLIEAMRRVQLACNALDEKWREKERLRAEERLAQERRNAELKAEKQLRSALACKIAVVMMDIESIREQDDYEIARSLIESSAWWLTHPYGPCLARGHCDRLKGSSGFWRIEFGSNSLHVSVAIRRSLETLESWLRRKMSQEKVSIAQLRASLVHAVSGSVSHVNGQSYDDYPIKGGYLRFGGTGIRVGSFVDRFLNIIGILDQFPA